MIEFKLAAISALLILALVSDLRTYRIKNSITYSFMLVGLAVNLALNGLSGVLFSLQGIMLPVVGLILLYMMRIIGAGDIKLLSALGAVMGAGFILNAAIYSFVSGGVIAAMLIIMRRNGIERFKFLVLYLKSCLISMELLQYADFKDKQDNSKFHFSIAVVSGTMAEVIISKLWLTFIS